MTSLRTFTPAFFVSVLLFACVASRTTLAQTAAAHSAESNLCPSFSPLHHSQPMYQDLKAVNLYVDIPPLYKEVLDCHGREEQCVKHASGYGLPEFKQEKYIQNLKQTYETYPKSLHRDALEAVYRDRLKTAFSSILPRDNSCQLQEPHVLDDRAVLTVERSANTITLTVRVSIIDNTKPRLAVLSTSYFRPDAGHANYLQSRPFSTAFPLDLPDSEVSAIVADFANRTAGERPIADYHQEGSQ